MDSNKKRLKNQAFFVKYPEGDSNSHVFRHTHLKRTCIPFQHLGKSQICLYTFRLQSKQTLEQILTIRIKEYKNENNF